MFSFPGFRIGLRPIQLEDLDSIMEWINDPDITRNFSSMSKKITREEEHAFLQRTIESPSDRLCAIVDTDGNYLGNAGVHKIYWPARNGRLGVVIGKTQAQGKGLGQEALKLLTAYGFMSLGLHKIWVVHFETNGRMKHIMKKLSYCQEGLLRDEYFHAGGFHNMMRHAMLEEEFSGLRAQWGIPEAQVEE